MKLADRFQVGNFAYAHRGLWSKNGPDENSLSAFRAASEAGLGIEFDIRPSADGLPMIFHDPMLDRMTNRTGPFEAYHSADLVDIQLRSGDLIPTLRSLLDVWPARTPLLCELKIDGSTDPIAFANCVSEMLADFSGPAAIMSFSRAAVSAVPNDCMRGQLIMPSKRSGEANLAATPIVPVDYLACHVSDAENASLQEARNHLPLVTWTVTDAETSAALAAVTDGQIFEGFDPGLVKRHIVNR